jgi:hypothetical protein
VWHNASTNETQIWFMNGGQVARRATVLGETGQPAYVGLPFRIAGVGDLNGDRVSDLVWHNDNTNETQIWFMNGNRVVQRATVLGETGQPVYVGVPFRMVGIGDLNGDGTADIVWHNDSTNETQIWFMNGNVVARRATVVDETGQPAYVGLPFSIAGVADLNGDGMADIVWHNDSTNETQIWLMSGGQVTRRQTVLGETGQPAYVGVPFRIVGVGDLNGDGMADIVWHNDNTNETQIWFMNGSQVSRRQTVLGETGQPAYVGLPYSIVGIGDFGGS